MKKKIALLTAAILLALTTTACSSSNQGERSHTPDTSKMIEQSTDTDVSENNKEKTSTEASQTDVSEESTKPEASAISADGEYENVFGFDADRWTEKVTKYKEDPTSRFATKYKTLVKMYNAYNNDRQMKDGDFLTGKVIYEKEYINENSRIDENLDNRDDEDNPEHIDRRILVKMDDKGNLLLKNANKITEEDIKKSVRNYSNLNVVYAAASCEDLCKWLNENFKENIVNDIKRIYLQTGVVSDADDFDIYDTTFEIDFPNLESLEYSWAPGEIKLWSSALKDITVPKGCKMKKIENCPKLETIRFMGSENDKLDDQTYKDAYERYDDPKIYQDDFGCKSKRESKLVTDESGFTDQKYYTTYDCGDNLKNLKTVYVPKGSDRACYWLQAKRFFKVYMNRDIEVIET